MRRLIVLSAIACMAQLAHAAEAGKVIFTAGKANVAEQAAAVGTSVEEGQTLTTGPDGFLYVKTIDGGLFILRPNSTARISAYHIDTQHPENTRVKLDLLSGVARSRSGAGVKQARQNFRFNTPVAAIGVRGTDFTVFTDNDTSRVAVLSGAIVMSGFGGACRADALGPCEGSASRELSAAQRGQLLQLQRGQAAPQLLQSSPLSPDQVSPPRVDEPLSHAGTANPPSQPNLDAEKVAKLSNALDKSVVTPPPVLPPPVEVTPPPVPVLTALQLPDRNIVWGRWQTVAGMAPTLILSLAKQDNEVLSVNGNYVLMRAQGPDTYIAPNNGTIGFNLSKSDAFVYTDFTPTYRIETPATLSNGTLDVNFGNKSFSTGFDLTSSAGNARLQATGVVSADGQLLGNPANSQPGLINVQGVLSNQNGGSAAYLFDGRLDDKRTVNGVTYWEKPSH